MVTFDKLTHTYAIVLPGNEHDYFQFLRALAHMVASVDEKEMDKETLYFVLTLLEEMLPTPEQNIRMLEEAS